MRTSRMMILLAAAVFLALLAPATTLSAYERFGLLVEGSDVISFGTFDYADATITIDTSAANPRGGAEFLFKGAPLSAGVEFAKSANDYDGEYADSDGSLHVDRSELVLFARLGSRDGSNLRVGYRRFKYEIEDAEVTVREDGVVTDRYINGAATGDLTTGIDVEGTLAFGKRFTFGVTIGGTYFKDAKYDWSYDVVVGDVGPRQGSATLDAYAVKIRPEVSFEIVKNLRAFLNYQLSATTWSGSRPEDAEDYVGTDVCTGVGLGARYAFSF